MALLRLANIELSYGSAPLFAGVNLKISAGEKLCLLGRNGAGKSTLMALIHGEIEADSGEVIKQQGLKIARLRQDVPADMIGSVYKVVASGLGAVGKLVDDYHQLLQHMDNDARAMAQLSQLQQQLDAAGGWDVARRVETTLSKMELNGDDDFAPLSGGMKRRVLLARALVDEPDILLLDEPTNHLDIAAINWLEQFLGQYQASLLFVSHDRALARRLATRVIELDRGKLTSWEGGYAAYISGKAAALEAEQRAMDLFDKKLAQEEIWIRQGIKARRTRNEGRVRALKALREERAQRRERQGSAKIDIMAASKSGKVVLEAQDLYCQRDGRELLGGLNLTLLRHDKVGIIGSNGCGKSTLLQILLNQLTPDQGSVRHGSNVEVAYFEQLYSSLDFEKTVVDNIGQGRDMLDLNGNERHVMSYLQDFLFTPDRARQPVKVLSGGEKNRLLLAKLFTKQFNLLVLDEPTNDLDAETLELLEERLGEFDGTLLLVSHDREFINNIVSSVLVFADGKVAEYVGGYDDYLHQIAQALPITAPSSAKPKDHIGSKAEPAKNKLSYKQQRELALLPEEIEALEQKIATMHQEMADASYYQRDSAAIKADGDQLQKAQQNLQALYQRWEELDAI